MFFLLVRSTHTIHSRPGADPGFDQGGGAQIVTGLKLPFWGLSFVEIWCWGLISGGQGGAGPPGPPGSAPGRQWCNIIRSIYYRLLSTIEDTIVFRENYICLE